MIKRLFLKSKNRILFEICWAIERAYFYLFVFFFFFFLNGIERQVSYISADSHLVYLIKLNIILNIKKEKKII